ncbi:uncharacterized protein TNCV_1586481 [Trichonephila clavipes]|nr:uncharacterized protein TNCV_1586481 [Trichonephila clavipes]
MSQVELPYVPILLDETFTKALWDTGAEKSFISEETYHKYFFYKKVKKLSTHLIMAQGAQCRNMGVVQLNIRIRDFKKPWLFHVLADLEYPCILGYRLHRWIKDHSGLRSEIFGDSKFTD